MVDHTGDKLLPDVLCSMGGTKRLKKSSVQVSGKPVRFFSVSQPYYCLYMAQVSTPADV